MSKPSSPQGTVSPRALAVLVFVAGITPMAGEIPLSRFIGPFFGSSLLVRTFIIFTVLLALTLGYVAGGNLADKHRSSEPLFRILTWAALVLGAGPFVMRLVLIETLDAKNVVEPAIGIILTMGTLILPMTLAGMAGPFIILVLAHRRDNPGGEAMEGWAAEASSVSWVEGMEEIIGTRVDAPSCRRPEGSLPCHASGRVESRLTVR